MDLTPHGADGRRLRDRRKAAGLSQAELAQQARIAQPYLSRIEKGWHQPSPTVQARLDAALEAAEEPARSVA